MTVGFFSSIWTAISSIVDSIRGKSKAEDDAKHEANKKAAEAEVARREAAAKEKSP